MKLFIVMLATGLGLSASAHSRASVEAFADFKAEVLNLQDRYNNDGCILTVHETIDGVIVTLDNGETKSSMAAAGTDKIFSYDNSKSDYTDVTYSVKGGGFVREVVADDAWEKLTVGVGDQITECEIDF